MLSAGAHCDSPNVKKTKVIDKKLKTLQAGKTLGQGMRLI